MGDSVTFAGFMRPQGGVQFPTGGRGSRSPEPASAAISPKKSNLGGTRVSRSGAAACALGGKLRQSWADGYSPDERRRKRREARIPSRGKPWAESTLIAAFALKRLSQHVTCEDVSLWPPFSTNVSKPL